MLLDTVNKLLEIHLGGAVTTNQLPVTTFWVDHTVTGAMPGSSDTQTNDANPVTIVAAPAAATMRQVMRLSIFNADTVDAEVTVQLNNNATIRTEITATLATGESLHYGTAHGWSVLSADGSLKSGIQGPTGDSYPFIARGGTLYNPDGITLGDNIIVWRAPYNCTVTNVRGYRVGGTGATINARRNGTDNHLAGALSLINADVWMDGGAVQNTAYVAGDKLEIMIVTVAGDPTQVAVQVDLTKI